MGIREGTVVYLLLTILVLETRPGPRERSPADRWSILEGEVFYRGLK